MQAINQWFWVHEIFELFHLELANHYFFDQRKIYVTNHMAFKHYHWVKSVQIRSYFLVHIFLYSVQIQENTDQK